MLGTGQKMNGFPNAILVDWDDEEWSLVAAELKRQHPSRTAQKFHNFEFTTMEVEDAAEEVLPQHRHRAITSFDPIKRVLFNAFQRVKSGQKPALSVVPGLTKSNGNIVWSPEEWEIVTNEIHALDPECFAHQCLTLSIGTVIKAQQVLPLNRHRSFKQIVQVRPQVYKTWEQIKANKADVAPPVIVEFPSGPVMAPQARKQDDNSALATAMHEAFKAVPEEAAEGKTRKKRVDWSASEWLDIAREMRRQNPHINYFANKFNVIDLPAIRDAQREALPFERRRTLAGTKGIQVNLVAAFAELLNEVNRENSAVEEPETIVDPAPVEVAKAAPVEVAKAAPSPFGGIYIPDEDTASAPQVFAQTGITNAAILNAAAPLFNLIVSELATRLAPAIAQAMMPELLKAISAQPLMGKPADLYGPVLSQPVGAVPAPATVSVAAPVVQAVAPVEVAPVMPQKRPTAAEIAAFNNVTVTKTKKPKIVLLGPMGRQKSDIEQAYPDYNFAFIEHGHGIKEAAVDCELFIIYTSHFNAANKSQVKKHVPSEKVRQVAGSISAVKHQIQAWEVANADVKH